MVLPPKRMSLTVKLPSSMRKIFSLVMIDNLKAQVAWESIARICFISTIHIHATVS